MALPLRFAPPSGRSGRGSVVVGFVAGLVLGFVAGLVLGFAPDFVLVKSTSTNASAGSPMLRRALASALLKSEDNAWSKEVAAKLQESRAC